MPIVFGLSLLSGIVVTVLFGSGLGLALRCAGVLALLTFMAITLRGTVPINQEILMCDVAAPPEDWQTLTKKWERLDTARTWAAISAFCLFLAAVLAQISN